MKIRVSKFPSVRVSKIHKIILCFGSILRSYSIPNFHFMLPWRYWSVLLFWKILMPYYQISISCFWIDIGPILSKFSFHVFSEDIDPIFMIPINVRRIFGFLRHPPIPRFSNLSISNILRFPPKNLFLKDVVFSWMNWSIGVMDTSTKSENHENDDCSSFPKMNPKRY